MSQFYSDLISLLTASAVGAAVLVGHVQISGDEADPVSPASTVYVAEATLEEVGVPASTDLRIQDIPEATLLQVSFTSTEDEIFPRRAEARSAAMGTVTGTTVNLRSGPGTGFAVAGQAVRDQALEATGATDGAWIEVMADGLDDPVWIHGKFFRAP